MSAISVEDEGWYSGQFQVCSWLDGNEMSNGYSSWSMGSSRPARPSRASWPSWCSSKSDVEGISDVLRVLVVITGAGGRGFIVFPRYNGPRDGLHCNHGLCRHSIAITCVVDWEKSAGCPLFVTPGTVWAS